MAGIRADFRHRIATGMRKPYHAPIETFVTWAILEARMGKSLKIRKAAVLGAGVMGAQIAAQLTNVGVDTVLFDLPAPEGPANGIVAKAIKHLGALKPAPLATPALGGAITAANYDSDLNCLADCDLVIEAIAERLEWKQDLYAKVGPYLSDHAVIASNTSGLSINALVTALPEHLRARFCGIHFFNPPRYMYLVEVIPAATTDRDMLKGLEAFLTRCVGKGVVYARDTPNFIGNRIGVFSILSTLHHTAQYGLGFDVVDALTGPAIGRAKSATYRTADVVGLDTLAHVVETMHDTLPDDPWNPYFTIPVWLGQLIRQGALGQKTGGGVYRKSRDGITVLDPAQDTYRPAVQKASDAVAGILALDDPRARFKALHESGNTQARFLWAIFRDLFHYSAFHLAAIADTARDVDLAMRWGYGWQLGPFETWQHAGWQQIAHWVAEDIAAGKAMGQVPLPDWVLDGRKSVHDTDGSYAPANHRRVARPPHPVYARQLFPDTIVGEPRREGTNIWENEGVRLWVLDDDDVGIVSFKTRMNTINDAVLDGLQKAVDTAEERLRALVVWQPEGPFSAGADLKGVLALLQHGKLAELEAMVANFQRTSTRIKYALVPVVAALRGLVLGGGCEIQMHAARSVAALESWVGQVEAGVGLLPAGGGLKELAVRASNSPVGDTFGNIQRPFETVAMARTSGSALEAKDLGLLRESDVIVPNVNELLYVAKAEALALSESAYRPPLPARRIKVAGDVGTATLKAKLVNLLAGHFISEHDLDIASRIAGTLCGGQVERGSEVDEQWLLDLERRHFLALAQTEKTQARIAHTMQTGKPLRN